MDKRQAYKGQTDKLMRCGSVRLGAAMPPLFFGSECRVTCDGVLFNDGVFIFDDVG